MSGLYAGAEEDLLDLIEDDDDASAGDIVGDIVGAIMSGAAPRRIPKSFTAPGGALSKASANSRKLAQLQKLRALSSTYNPVSPVVDYQPWKPTKARRYSLGFNATLAASATAVVTNQPQVVFRPERVIVPSAIGGNFTVIDIKVGNKSQLAASGALPALMFSELAIGTDQSFDTALISQTITLSVQNTDSGAAHAFSAAMIGTVVDQLRLIASASVVRSHS